MNYLKYVLSVEDLCGQQTIGSLLSLDNEARMMIVRLKQVWMLMDYYLMPKKVNRNGANVGQ